MPARNPDLHGNVPDRSPVALVLIDVINDFEYETGEALLKHALPMADRLAALKRRCTDAGVPAIYVNDNFGKWRSDQRSLIEHCLEDGVRGEPFVRKLLPSERDYFVLKPKHSGFYSTTLDTLLQYLRVRTLILTGLTTELCVLFTASDGYMRDLHQLVPSDCVAGPNVDEHKHALKHMQRVLDVRIVESESLDPAALREAGAAGD